MLVVRAARRADHGAFIDLARKAGPGFTSLSLDDAALEDKLAKSEDSYAGRLDEPSDVCYQLMLEESESGEIFGTAAVKAAIGLKKPYFDFKIFTLAQASKEADQRFDMEAMLLVNDFAGSTEVGSLYVRDAARGTGAGRLIAQSRYMLMAADTSRFGDTVVAELRGVVDAQGYSPFYEYVTRPFFRMSFEEADRLSAATDNQFILDLMPVHPIYVDLLPSEARAVIGQTHPHGVNARRLLEWEGFEYDRYVDIFDAGPLVSCRTEKVRTIRNSRRVSVGDATGEAVQAMVSTDRIDDFRCVFTEIVATEERVRLSEQARRALDLTHGEAARIWVRE
ncbi:arginine N-succinyltransferase [Marinicauda algicola]|uniref:Arginine N-succinyltransferase n=1 Tax=Marinicauda algicola TaxID=2029849 RepID=A0A4S2H298_9PROT|nr:arginine N-succinyltransferase [Marinicauda algicola]TGY89646.1 arginine N-succinyltransferase [Marinicauda algicola]